MKIIGPITVPNTEVKSVELSLRARNCLTEMGIKSLGQLAGFSGQELLNRRNVGVKVLREMAQTCLTHNIIPHFVKDCTIRFELSMPLPENFKRLSGPYTSAERWMLEFAIAQLGEVPWQVIQEEGGLVLYRSGSGYKEVEDEI